VIDTLLTYPWLAIAFTAFALAGVTHAFNMIDGLNGLSGYTALWILGAYGLLAYAYDDYVVIQICLLLAAPTLGFLFFNWPWGKCFLGDGGAYLLGFACAWIGVVLVERHPQISPFAPLLICSYPVIEAFYSMARRAVLGRSSGLPDREHLHQIMVTGVVDPWLKAHPGTIKSNSLAGFLLSLFPLPFLALAILFNTHQGVMVALFILSVLVYSLLYQALRTKTQAQLAGAKDPG
jgi:UDP-N-acetylmuramyl pentapeptide phosphotransferase/UDP-N-acetylglucosamine-1-phosphate transferase